MFDAVAKSVAANVPTVVVNVSALAGSLLLNASPFLSAPAVNTTTTTTAAASTSTTTMTTSSSSAPNTTLNATGTTNGRPLADLNATQTVSRTTGVAAPITNAATTTSAPPMPPTTASTFVPAASLQASPLYPQEVFDTLAGMCPEAVGDLAAHSARAGHSESALNQTANGTTAGMPVSATPGLAHTEAPAAASNAISAYFSGIRASVATVAPPAPCCCNLVTTAAARLAGLPDTVVAVVCPLRRGILDLPTVAFVAIAFASGLTMTLLLCAEGFYHIGAIDGQLQIRGVKTHEWHQFVSEQYAGQRGHEAGSRGKGSRAAE